MLNGYVMSKDKVVVEIKNDEIVNRDILLCPLMLKNANTIDIWLESRAIDRHRVNSRLLKRILRISEKSDKDVVLFNNAVSITDNFWYKDINSNLKWEDVKFNHNYFDKLALKGDSSSFNLKPSTTPELTNIGSYEKCWSLENNKWIMYKNESIKERFSEYLIFKIGKELNFDMAEYFLTDSGVKTIDFTENNKYNFEPAQSLVGDDINLEKNYNELKKLNPDLTKDFLRMCYLDALCFNMDRHTQNYGILRNSETGEIVKMAPNFDNNIALIFDKYPEVSSAKILREDFVNLLLSDSEIYKEYKDLEIKELDSLKIDNILKEINLNVDKEKIKSFILENQKVLRQDIEYYQSLKEKQMLSRMTVNELEDQKDRER